jgi:hypothetical protein
MWMDNFLKGIPRTPMMHDLFIAIVHAKKVDNEQPFSTPNILYTLMKGVVTNIEHMQTISDAFHSHFGNKRPETYFIIDSRGVPRKRLHYV